MCGIAAFFAKTEAREREIGRWFTPMLDCLTGRGPDSAGFAIYRNPAPSGFCKLVLQHPEPRFDWAPVAAALGATNVRVVHNHAVLLVPGEAEARQADVAAHFPELTLMSAGEVIEIFKEKGLPCEVMQAFALAEARGSHAIGHTRMATESAVTTAGSHPFSTGCDLCLVHNGSLSNHNRLRRNLQREGIRFRTENDSEVAAGYLAWRLKQGDSLEAALEGALRDLDGFFTFAIGTRDGFAVLRDPIACKPAILAETDDYVAMASEYRALAHLPGIDQATIWEPEPARIYTWSKNAPASRLAA